MSHSIKHSTRVARWIFAAMLGLAAHWASAGHGGGGAKTCDADSRVFAPDTLPYDLSYAQWSARHWQWFYSLPVDANPLFDTADVSAGQSGNVWFLGGTFAPSEIAPNVFVGDVTRQCVIPSGTALFFPLVDVEASTLEGYGNNEKDLRASAEFLAAFIDPGSLSLEIDGVPVSGLTNYGVESPLFTFGPLPDDNVLEAQGYDAPQGATTASVSDGYFAMVKALPVGTHTIHFTGTLDASSIGGPIFIQDITYNLTVAPRGQVGK
jgi:hypothetical protein